MSEFVESQSYIEYGTRPFCYSTFIVSGRLCHIFIIVLCTANDAFHTKFFCYQPDP